MEYDIKATEFMLPVLSVQPVVENAVYHGLFEHGTGGAVTIKTDETESAFLITVADDGVGFDNAELTMRNAELKTDKRQHVGIENVRSRLAAMCGGTLTIQSSPGNGTTAIISIPKNGELKIMKDNEE